MGDPAESFLFVHLHDLGRQLGSYGAVGARSPRLDRLAAQGIRWTDAHSTAPLCSPARASLFTGRYPHEVGMDGLAHHGFGYPPGVRTMPAILGEHGYATALFGMQHESLDPATLGYAEWDTGDDRCDWVVERAGAWLDDHADRAPDQPFLLVAGMFETHRPWDDYEPVDPDTIRPPGFLPDVPAVRGDLAGMYGALERADAAIGRLLNRLAASGLADQTWVIITTDHGIAFPGAKSTLAGAGTEIALIIRPPGASGIAPAVRDDLFSGVDLLPTMLGLAGVPIPDEVSGVSHADRIRDPRHAPPPRESIFTERTYHDDYDPMRAVRTGDWAYRESYTDRPRIALPLDIAESPSATALDESARAPRPRRELYRLADDPYETTNLAEDERYARIRDELAVRLAHWRADTGDELPDEAAGNARAAEFMARWVGG